MREGYKREIPVEEVAHLKDFEKEMVRALETIPEGTDDAKPYLCERALFLGRILANGKEVELGQSISDAAARVQNNNVHDFAMALAKSLHEFILANCSAEEVEQAIRNYHMHAGRDTPINELLRYHVHEDTNLYLHVNSAKTLPVGKQLKLLRDGLHLLAAKLQTDPDLKKIGVINAVSWIVAANPSLLAKMGFTYVGNVEKQADDPRDMGAAYISRENFLKRYGSANP